MHLAIIRLVAFSYQGTRFGFIFGDMKDDLGTSDLKNRFDIPDRGLALKKVETCLDFRGYVVGFEVYDKQDKKIFDWQFEDCQQTITTTLKDGERIIDFMISWNNENTDITYLEFVLSNCN